MEGISVDCPGAGPGRIPLLSCNVDGRDARDVGAVLDGDYDIAVRAGLHCAPLAHRHLGHTQAGSVRLSLGPSNTFEEVQIVLRAFADLCGTSRSVSA